LRKKFFFFDIDGTLAYGITGIILPETIATIETLQKNGHFVAIATGRLQCSAVPQCKILGIQNMVSDGGNALTLHHKIIHMHPLPKQPILDLIAELEQNQMLWAYTAENKTIRHTKYAKFKELAGPSNMDTLVHSNIEVAAIEQFYKIYIYYPNLKELNTLPSLTDLPQIHYNNNMLLIEPTHKEKGIFHMMEYLKGDLADVVVFGDGINDLSMFRPEWFSVAMGNAIEVLKQKADFVTKRCEDGGITYACQHFGWI